MAAGVMTQGLSKRQLGLMVFAVAAIVSVAQFLYIFQEPESDLVLRLAQEVVSAHEGPATDSIDATDYEELSKQLAHKEFAFKIPERIRMGDYRIAGARELAIHNSAAAQIQLTDQQGESISLFAIPTNDEFRPLHNRQLLRGAWLVSFWFEGDLFFMQVAPTKN